MWVAREKALQASMEGWRMLAGEQSNQWKGGFISPGPPRIVTKLWTDPPRGVAVRCWVTSERRT